MPGTQTDPIWLLSMSQQRQADLLASVRHDALVQVAMRYCAGRALPNQNRLHQIVTLAAAAVRHSLRLAASAPAPVHGG